MNETEVNPQNAPDAPGISFNEIVNECGECTPKNTWRCSVLRFLSSNKVALFIFITMFFTGTSFAANCTSISQNGITWTFSASVECDKFVNGDWWVVAPVTINNTTPAWTGADHGSMLDPAAGLNAQGYHSGIVYGTPYSGSLRVSFPTTISSGVKSIVSTITDPAYTGTGTPRSFVRNAAVLTIVNSAPSATSFRPTFMAGAKTIYDSASVNYSLVPSYTAPGTALNLTGKGNMPTLNYGGKVFGEENWIPSNDYGGVSYPPYAATNFVNQVSMMMMLNTANRVSYINKLIQIGIDDYAKITTNDYGWMANGGYGGGHIWPIIFAGKMLNSATLLSVPRFSTSYPLAHNNAEQGYTYYNSAGTAMFGNEECLAGTMAYPPTSCSNVMCRPQTTNVGPPAGFPENYWGACGGGYRTLVSPNYAGQALAMRMLEPTLGTMTAFNHPAFFGYTDYWAANPQGPSGQSPTNDYQTDVYAYGGTGNGFMKYMWDTYRNSMPSTLPPPPSPGKIPSYPIITPLIQ